jgi:DNA-directed RNA polymerase subunit F
LALTTGNQIENATIHQHFLQLVKRLYEKRDEILESSQRLVEYAHRLEDCAGNELKDLLSEIGKELNRIIADIHELSPHLKNPNIAAYISEQARMVNIEMESLAYSSGALRAVHKRKVATYLRTTICQDANKTELKPTPKSIERAYGVEVSMHDIIKLKGYFEHWQDNY